MAPATVSRSSAAQTTAMSAPSTLSSSAQLLTETELGMAGGGISVIAGSIRIVAALVNPEGHDAGKETLTLINTGPAQESLDGWRLEDKNGQSQSLSDVTIAAGETVRLRLAPSGVQLSNKGGRVSLIDASGHAVHTVSYSKGQAKTNGETILF